MIVASGAFQTGQFIGLLIVVVVGVGVVRTLSRSDLTWREKIVGKKKPR